MVNSDISILRRCTKLICIVFKRYRIKCVLELPGHTLIEYKIWRELPVNEFCLLKHHPEIDCSDIHMNIDYLLTKVNNLDLVSTKQILNIIRLSLDSRWFNQNQMSKFIRKAADYLIKDYSLDSETTRQTLDIIKHSLNFEPEQITEIISKFADYIFSKDNILLPDATPQTLGIIEELLDWVPFDTKEIAKVIRSAVEEHSPSLDISGQVWTLIPIEDLE